MLIYIFYPSEPSASLLVYGCNDNFSSYILIHPHRSKKDLRSRGGRKVSDAAANLDAPLYFGDVVSEDDEGGGGAQVPDDGLQAVRRREDGKDGLCK